MVRPACHPPGPEARTLQQAAIGQAHAQEGVGVLAQLPLLLLLAHGLGSQGAQPLHRLGSAWG